VQLTRALPFVILLTIPFAGCASPYPDIKVETEAHAKVQFDGYKTYKWAAAAAVIRDAAGTWNAPDLDIGSEIMFLTNRELRGRGLVEVVDSPDLAVIYAIGVDMEALNVVVDKKSGVETKTSSPKGGVLILLMEPDTRRVVWAGRATADLSEKPTPELAKKRLDYAISQLFKKYGK